VLPTDATYHRDRQMLLFSVQEFPQLIVFCEVFEDARRCLEFAANYDLRVSIRSGGTAPPDIRSTAACSST